MKTLSTIYIFLLIALLSQNVCATVYSTISNGDIDEVTVWTPTLPSDPCLAGDTMIILHQVNMTTNWTIEGVMIVESGAILENDGKTLNIAADGTVIINGLLKTKNINNDGLLTNNGRIEIYGNLINNGTNSNINGTNGVFRLQNRAINNAGGFISGTVDFCRFDEISDPVLSNSGVVEWNTVTVCNGGVLPIVLSSFTAFSTNHGVAIEWSTETEKDNRHFELEKSINGKEFSTIAIVPAKNGDDVSNNYEVQDLGEKNKNVFYRLKQIDVNGNAGVTKVIVYSRTGKEFVEVYPNPCSGNDDLTIQLEAENAGLFYITITNETGSFFFSREVNADNTISYTLPANEFTEVPGIYFVQVTDGNKSKTRKLIIE